MATVKSDLSAKYQTTKDGDIEEVHFAAGTKVTIVQTWQDHVLIKDADGHYYTIKKELVEP